MEIIFKQKNIYMYTYLQCTKNSVFCSILNSEQQKTAGCGKRCVFAI